jgi:hypothetical protein
MLDAEPLLVLLRAVLVICGTFCIALGYGAFRSVLRSNAELRLKLGKEYSNPWGDLVPGLVLVIVGAAAAFLAYFRAPSC